MIIYSIYRATNKINGKTYIGYTKNIHARKLRHKRSTSHLGNAIRKYGLDGFDWEIICQSKDSDYLLNVMEPYFIKQYNPEYNKTLGGEGATGPKSDIHKKKISIANKDKPKSKEHREAMSIAQKNRRPSLTRAANIAKAKLGKPSGKLGKKYPKNLQEHPSYHPHSSI
jgi:group I intron endonuclease